MLRHFCPFWFLVSFGCCIMINNLMEIIQICCTVQTVKKNRSTVARFYCCCRCCYFCFRKFVTTRDRLYMLHWLHWAFSDYPLADAVPEPVPFESVVQRISSSSIYLKSSGNWTCFLSTDEWRRIFGDLFDKLAKYNYGLKKKKGEK